MKTPTDITLTGGSVDENAAAGTTVATLSTVDADAGDSHTYAITNDPSGFFEVVGNEVRVAAGANIDFETDQTHDITVQTTDAAGNTYSEVVTITVNDLIDENPTDITLTGGSVDENAAAGTTVATLSTVDADSGDSHTYAITNDPSGFFEIVGDEVRVAAGANIDFETDQTHDITVQTTDAAGNTYSEVVTITVNDLIDENPTDITLIGGSVDENAAAGTTVATLSTVDADASDTHTYAITNDPSGFFEVVGNEVRVAAGANIDFETDQTHDITVQTTDAAGNTYSEVVTINVNDLIDENPTDITLTGGSVDENAAAGTTVATLSTVDADAGDSHTYAITNDPSGFFEVAGNEVRVAAGANIDFETDQTHDITVETTDAAGNTYSEVVTITVNDLIDENPTDITLTGGSVDENAASGTTVATLSTVDADAGDSHTYAITNDPSGFFEIVGDEVRVAAGANIDFETDQTHDITVETTDAAGNTYSEVVTIAVNDLIDENPTDITLTGGSVDENAAAGTTVATLSTVDADASDTHTYAITNDPSGFFEILGDEVRVAAGASIDFETDQSHDITVQTTDAAGNTYSEVVTITVNDLIDENPTDITLTGGTVDENAAVGTTVATLSTVDADASDSHTYAITNDPSGFFEVVGNEVRVAAGANIDFETDQSHDITVQTTDAAGNTYSEVVTIAVNDLIDENPTDITLAGGSVDENAAAGTTVATLSTVDADAGDSHTYAITNDASGFFEVVGNEVRVAAGASIDFETDQTHDITVETTDAAGNTYSEVVTITVNDLIDENPTDITLTGGSVDENAAAGTTVATLSSVDADAGDSHTYAITNDPSGFFEVVGNEVRVAAGASIDFETDQTHDITIQSTDAAGNTYSEVVTLTVNDVNEAPTDITFTGGSVDENADGSQTGISLNQDGGNDAYLQVTDSGDIVGGLSEFTIEVDFSSPGNGGTYTNLFSYHAGGGSDEIELGINVGSPTEFYIEVGEQATPVSGFDASQVLDGNDHQVSMTWDNTSGDWEVYVDGASVASGTGIAAGHTIASGGEIVLGQEQDSQDGGYDSAQHFAGTYNDVRIFDDVRTADEINDNLFAEVSNTEPGLVANWQMNDLSGGVTTDTVSGNDLTVGQATGTGFIASTPVLTTEDGVLVATLSTTDPDAGDSHTYAITNDPSGFFEVVGNEVRVASNADIDFEANPSHDITIETTDSAGNTYTEVVTITVNDLIDENPTDITLAGGVVDENAAAGTTVATLSTVDADASDSHTYAISNDPSGFFEVVGNEVRVAAGATIDFETDTSHNITVETTDAAGNTYSEVVTVTVNDVNEAPTDIAMLKGGDVNENVVAGTPIAVLGTTDQDAGDSHTYAITNDPSGFFEVVGNQVQVAAGASIDFETDQTHDITIETTDSAGNTYSEVVTITVNDVNEAPTDITLSTEEFGGSVVINDGGATNEYVEATNFADFPTDELSFEMRMTVDQPPASGIIMFASYAVDSTFDEEFAIIGEVGGNLFVNIHGTSLTGDAADTGIALSSLTDGAEHMLSITWDSATGALDVYVDGTSQYSGTYEQGTTLTQGGTLIFGQDQDSVGGSFNGSEIFSGSIDEVRIFDDVRTAQEISDNWQGEITDPANEQGLVSNYQMTSDAGGQIADVAGNNPLTVVNAAEVVDNTTVDTGTVIGTAAGVDPDAGDTLTYALTDDAGGMFAIDSNTGEISIEQGSAATPQFTQQTGSANPYNGIDVGSYSNPALVDIDGDGDLDAFAGDSSGNVRYFENTGSSTNPSFASQVTNPFGLADVGSFSAPTFADIDGDGDFDAFVGDSSGNIDFFENTGTSTSASFSSATTNPFGLTDVGSYATPEFADIDGDGDLDAFVTDRGGNIDYFENTGTSTSASFATSITNPFGFSDVGSFADITLGDIDGDGDIDALVGDTGGNLDYFENTGTSTSPSFVSSGANPYGLSDIGNDATPVLADLDGDGDLDLTVGESNGTINYFENAPSGSTTVDLTSVGSQTVTVEVTDSGGLTHSEQIGIQFGTSGDDSLTGTASDDLIYGFDGADTLTGGAGDDILSGGLGDDTLTGGDGSELFLFHEGDGNDVADGGAGAGWTDTLEIMDSTGGSDIGVFGADWTVTITSGSIDAQDTDSITLAQDTDGFVTLQDGSQFTFTDLERIEW